MELKLYLKDRQVTYELAGEKGESLENLIKLVGKKEFDKISIYGETKSYTFLRQVALLVNILSKTKVFDLSLNSNSFEKKAGVLLPIYEQ